MGTRIPRRLIVGGCLWCLCVGATPAHGQTTGQIAGIVRDRTGAVLVGAEVTIVRDKTGDRRRVTTDQAGSYRVPLLTPDTYQVAIAAPGFQTVQFADVRVGVTETATINADMTPAPWSNQRR